MPAMSTKERAKTKIHGNITNQCKTLKNAASSSVPKTRAQRALRAHKLARAYVPTRLTRLRALSRAL